MSQYVLQSSRAVPNKAPWIPLVAEPFRRSASPACENKIYWLIDLILSFGWIVEKHWGLSHSDCRVFPARAQFPINGPVPIRALVEVF